MIQILYLWDLAGTLFSEEWQTKKTELPNFEAYLESLGHNLKSISPQTYEFAYEYPFKQDLLRLRLMPGCIKTLSWTKHNAAFTTGNLEQMDWRAEVFIKQGVPDIRRFFETIYSTFDYANTNLKTTKMFIDILKREAAKDYKTIVYADNNLKNCRYFIKAAAKLPLIKSRVYHIEQHKPFRKKTSTFFQAPNLLSIQKNEKRLLEKTGKML